MKTTSFLKASLCVFAVLGISFSSAVFAEDAVKPAAKKDEAEKPVLAPGERVESKKDLLISRTGYDVYHKSAEIAYEFHPEDAKEHFGEGGIKISVQFSKDSFPPGTSASGDKDKDFSRLFLTELEGKIGLSADDSKNPLNDSQIDFVPYSKMKERHYDNGIHLDLERGTRFFPMTFMRDLGGGTEYRATVSGIGYAIDSELELVPEKLSAVGQIIADVMGVRTMGFSGEPNGTGLQIGRVQAEAGLHYDINSRVSLELVGGADVSGAYGNYTGQGSRLDADKEFFGEFSTIVAYGKNDRHEVAFTLRAAQEQKLGQEKENVFSFQITFEGKTGLHRKHTRASKP